jgi:hypothetical protein
MTPGRGPELRWSEAIATFEWSGSLDLQKKIRPTIGDKSEYICGRSAKFITAPLAGGDFQCERRWAGRIGDDLKAMDAHQPH